MKKGKRIIIFAAVILLIAAGIAAIIHFGSVSDIEKNRKIIFEEYLPKK